MDKQESAQQAAQKTGSANRSRPNPDRLVWFERSRAMVHYSDALKEADDRAMKLFDLISGQMQRQFTYMAVVFFAVLVMALVVFIASLVILVFFSANPYMQIFSLVGMPVSILTLLLLLFLNPITRQRNFLASMLKLNIIYLSLVRRIQQSDVLLQYIFYENEPFDLSKVIAVSQDFQSSVDQLMEELNRMMQN